MPGALARGHIGIPHTMPWGRTPSPVGSGTEVNPSGRVGRGPAAVAPGPMLLPRCCPGLLPASGGLLAGVEGEQWRSAFFNTR